MPYVDSRGLRLFYAESGGGLPILWHPAAFAGAYEAFATAPPFWPAAGQNTAPTLLLLGVGDDEQEWWALGQAAASTMPDALAVALPGLGHLQAFWRTDLSLPPIREFLAKLSATAQTWRRSRVTSSSGHASGVPLN
jgi:hypothetical protein